MDLEEQDVIKAQSGERHAFVTIIKCCEPTMYRVSKAILISDEDCADAMQETIIKAYSSIKNLHNPKYFKTWLIRILINECRRILNEQKQVFPLQNYVDINTIAVDAEETTFELQDLLSDLMEDLRVTVTLFYVEDLSIKEISNLLDIPEGTVKSRLHRAKKQLYEMMSSRKGGNFHHGSKKV